MIDHERQFLHVHIHRCAGASVEKFFNSPHLYDHRRPEHYVDQFGEDTWKDYYTFALIRNPWAKVLSHYMWRQQRAWWYAPGDELGFKDWIKNFDKIKENLGDKNKPQITWLSHKGIEVDDVIKVSELDQEWGKICERAGVETKPLPRYNATEHKHYSVYYDDETKGIVRDWYKPDIKKFGFEFEDVAEDRLKELGYLG